MVFAAEDDGCAVVTEGEDIAGGVVRSAAAGLQLVMSLEALGIVALARMTSVRYPLHG